MTPAAFASVAVLALAIAAGAAQAGTLVIELDWRPDPGQEISTKPVVLDLRSDTPVDREAAVTQSWSYPLEYPGAITLPLRVELDDVPPGYAYAPLQVELPFSEEKNLNLIAALSLKVDRSGRRVRELYGTNPRQVTPRKLQQLYQETRLIAGERMGRVGDDWTQVNEWDVKVVYKFLESAYVIAERTPIDPVGPLRSAFSARDWLQQASDNAPEVVSAALAGTRGPADLISHVDRIDGVRFAKLWRSVEDLECPMKIRMMEAFREEIRSLDSSERRDAVLRTIGVSYAEIQKRINRCSRDLAMDREVAAEERLRILDRQIRASEAEAERTGSEAAAEALTRDAGYFRTLSEQLRALPAGGTR